MKSCPQCRQTYSDDYSFCLTDGSSLVPDVPQGEIPTVVIPREQASERKGRGILVYVLAGLLSLSLGVTVAVLYFFWPRNTAVTQVDRTESPTPTASPPPTATPSPTATATPRPTEQPTPDSEALQDPGPTRVTFDRGRIESTVSGRVVDQRSFLLQARDGQRLSASVSSDDDCVVFENGSRRTAFTTSAGDNELMLLNECDGPVSFRLTVQIR